MNSEKILIIEDQAPMRRNVALMLELEGYDTCTAENGRIGVEVARQEKPDLILCDVMMPELDGYGVVQAVFTTDHDMSSEVLGFGLLAWWLAFHFYSLRTWMPQRRADRFSALG